MRQIQYNRFAPHGGPRSASSRGMLMVWCTLIALLSFGTHIAHFALVAHQVCAEHGDLAHGAHGHVHDGARHAHGSSHTGSVGGHDNADKHVTLTVKGSEGSDDDHGHCDALIDDGVSCVVGAAWLTANALWELVDGQPTQFVFVQRLFLLAPKTSPPVAI